MWESRPLPKIVRDPLAAFSARGSFLYGAPPCGARLPDLPAAGLLSRHLAGFVPAPPGILLFGHLHMPSRKTMSSALWSSPALWGENRRKRLRGPWRIVQAGRGMSLAGDPGRDMGGEESPCGPRGSEFRGEPQGSRMPGGARAGRLTLQSCPPDGYLRAELMEQRGGRRTDEQSDARGEGRPAKPGKGPLFRCS